MKKPTSYPRVRRGGAAVEAALLLPLFIVLLSAILDYGYYFFIASSATQAVRNGVRMGVTKDNVSTMEQLAADHAVEAMENFNLTCKTSLGCKLTHKHKSLTYSGDTFQTYQLSMERPFIAPMGMVPSPKYHYISYTMRYEF
jgi:Flp pilus assembly protein TadG